jgi:hypothetical protein
LSLFLRLGSLLSFPIILSFFIVAPRSCFPF